jgi:hypothetical protein
MRVNFDGERSNYLEGEISKRLQRIDRIPQMQWYDIGMRDMALREVNDD